MDLRSAGLQRRVIGRKAYSETHEDTLPQEAEGLVSST